MQIRSILKKSCYNVCGQSSFEYAVIIAVTVAALLSMQVYIKRGIQGRLRESADSIGQQYDPGNTESSITTTMSSNTTTEVKTILVGEGADAKLQTTTNTTIHDETDQVEGEEDVGPLGSSL